MTIGLDTSVVVRLLVGEPGEQAETARRLVLDHSEQVPVMVSDLVVGESYFALRHHYRVPHNEALEALRVLLTDPVIRTSTAVQSVVAHSLESNAVPGFMDRLIHAGYQHQGAELVTFDHDAARLEGARLLE